MMNKKTHDVIPLLKRTGIRLLILVTIVLVFLSAVYFIQVNDLITDLKISIFSESSKKIGRISDRVSDELVYQGEKSIQYQTQQLFHEQLVYLFLHPDSKNLDSAEKLIQFCIHDEGYQRLVNRKVQDYGYTTAAIADGERLISVAHPKKDTIGQELFQSLNVIPEEQRRKLGLDQYIEDWKNQNSRGFYYQQPESSRPHGLPAEFKQKYAYHYWGAFRGIRLVIEATVYINEFKKPLEEIKKEHRALNASIEGVIQSTRKTGLRNLAITVLIALSISIAICFLISRTMIEKPVQKLIEGLDKFGQGNLDELITVDSESEFGFIADCSNKMAEKLNGTMKQLESVNQSLEDQVEIRTEELTSERDRVNSLLLNVLPRKIVSILEKKEQKTIAHDYAMATILFSDFKGFTSISESVPPERLVMELNEIFACFDDLCMAYNMEKIKTIGDAYMAAGGLPEKNSTHPADAVRMGIAMVEFISLRLKDPGKLPFQIRIGIHSGPVIAGVIGKSKFTYDIWGGTVNIASRMESTSEPGKINVSEDTYKMVNDQFDCVDRGLVEVKGIGQMRTYFVIKPRSS